MAAYKDTERNTWYVAGINAQKEPVKAKLSFPMFEAGKEVSVYADNEQLEGSLCTKKLNKKGEMEITIPCNGGIVISNKY